MAMASLEKPALASKLNAPLIGISDEDHVKAWRQTAYQRTEKGNCTYCEQYGHGPAICRYINPHHRPENWKPDPKLWVYMGGAQNGRLKHQKKTQPANVNKKVNPTNRVQPIWAKRSQPGGKHVQAAPVVNTQMAPMVTTPMARVVTTPMAPAVTTQMTPVVANPMTPPMDLPIYGNNTQFDLIPLPINRVAASKFPQHRWAVILGYFHHIANSKDCFIDYHEYTPGEIPYRFRDQIGTLRTALGVGRVKINLSDGMSFYGELILNAVYCPGLPCNLLSLAMATRAMNLFYSIPTYTLNDISTNNVVAFTFQQDMMPFLKTTHDLIA